MIFIRIMTPQYNYMYLLALWTLTALGKPNPGTAFKLPLPRQEYMHFLRGKEGRVFFDNCHQSSRSDSCIMAMDDSYSVEPAQCSSTEFSERPSWTGMLVSPTYITKITILNINNSYRAYPDGLISVVVSVNGEVCSRLEVDASFDKRTFPCDASGETITIQSSIKSVLTICDIEVLGVPYQIPSAMREPIPIPIGSCFGSGELKPEGCRVTHDNNSDTCVVARPDSNNSGSFVFTFDDGPALVTGVRITSKSMSKFYITVQEYGCVRYSNNTPVSNQLLRCREGGIFNTQLTIHNADGNEAAPLELCEIQIYGYLPDVESSPNEVPIGCFKDSRTDLDLPQLVSSTRVTLSKCLRMCKRLAMKYFAIQAGRHCFCGSSYGKHGPAADPKVCNVKCEGGSGSKSDLCGGMDEHNSVYEVGGFVFSGGF